MEELKEIGFYTLSNERVKNVSHASQLMRCELILTDACNFKCAYCKPQIENCRGNMPIDTAKSVILEWSKHNLKNIRFSGGEPTIYKGLTDLVKFAKANGIERIAVSSNGSASLDNYKELIAAGVNDFSISLDAPASACLK